MGGITIGFGESGGDGFFGSLGRSVAAAMSPQAQGVGGTVRAFLNPGPTLGAEARNEQVGQLQQLWQQNEQMIGASFKALEAGDKATATQIMGQVEQNFQKGGIDPGASIRPIFERMAGGYDQARLRSMTPGSQDYLPKLGSVLNTPGEGMDLAKTMQGNQESQTREAFTRQKMDQDKQLFPSQLEGAGLGNDLTRSQMQTEASRRAEMAQRGGLIGAQTEGQNLGNQFDKARNEFFQQRGMLPGTAGAGGRGPDYLDDEARHAKAVSDAVSMLQGGKKGPYKTEPYSPDEAQQSVAALNSFADELERRTGRPQPRVTIDQGQARVSQGEDGESITQPGGAVPRVRMGAQQQQQEQQPAFNEPLTKQALSKVPDGEVGNVSFDENSLSPQQRELVRGIRREAQAAIKQAPASQRREMLKAYNRKVLEALAGGGQ